MLSLDFNVPACVGFVSQNRSLMYIKETASVNKTGLFDPYINSPFQKFTVQAIRENDLLRIQFTLILHNNITRLLQSSLKQGCSKANQHTDFYPRD